MHLRREPLQCCTCWPTWSNQCHDRQLCSLKALQECCQQGVAQHSAAWQLSEVCHWGNQGLLLPQGQNTGLRAAHAGARQLHAGHKDRIGRLWLLLNDLDQSCCCTVALPIL